MRGLAAIAVVALLVGGIYYFYVRKMPTAAEGTAPTQAISLTGVQSDLLQIAQGERTFIVTNGRCGSLDELISSQTILMTRRERDGYSYSVECSGTDFTVAARHASAPDGSPVRYPSMSVDQTLQVHVAH